jgi:AbrB family looped-hinge helix DNA binding protein
MPFGYGKMPFMNAIAEIDAAGRVVIPKKMRDSLHLVKGARVCIQQRGDLLVIAPEAKPRGLYLDRGTLVYDAGPVPPSDVVQWIDEDRAARMKAAAGDRDQP